MSLLKAWLDETGKAEKHKWKKETAWYHHHHHHGDHELLFPFPSLRVRYFYFADGSDLLLCKAVYTLTQEEEDEERNSSTSSNTKLLYHYHHKLYHKNPSMCCSRKERYHIPSSFLSTSSCSPWKCMNILREKKSLLVASIACLFLLILFLPGLLLWNIRFFYCLSGEIIYLQLKTKKSGVVPRKKDVYFFPYSYMYVWMYIYKKPSCGDNVALFRLKSKKIEENSRRERERDENRHICSPWWYYYISRSIQQNILASFFRSFVFFPPRLCVFLLFCERGNDSITGALIFHTFTLVRECVKDKTVFPHWFLFLLLLLLTVFIS